MVGARIFSIPVNLPSVLSEEYVFPITTVQLAALVRFVDDFLSVRILGFFLVQGVLSFVSLPYVMLRGYCPLETRKQLSIRAVWAPAIRSEHVLLLITTVDTQPEQTPFSRLFRMSSVTVVDPCLTYFSDTGG